MICAAIDVGTNSVKLLVGRVSGRKVVPVLHRAAITRLGEGLQASGRIAAAAADRTLAAVAEFHALARERKADRIEAVGTLALRAAANAKDFLRRCAAEAGIELRVLTGEEEAGLSFQGAAWAAKAEQVLAIDIGGGSTEIMVGDRSKLHAAWSLPVGAVTLTEQFLREDPPGAEELMRLSAEVRRHLAQVVARVGQGGELVGVGGTVSAVLGLLRRASGDDPRKAHRKTVSYEAISALSIHLSLKTTAQREEMGLERGRADIVVAGAWILSAAMSHLAAPTLRAAVHGLRHGLLIEMASGPRS